MDQIEEKVGREQYEKALIFKKTSPRIWQIFKILLNMFWKFPTTLSCNREKKKVQ